MSEDVAMDSDAANSVKTSENPKRVHFLDVFNKVNHPQQVVRIKNAIAVVLHLQRSENSETELKYTVQRLLRGLGSSNVTCRQGFYAILVALLKMIDHGTMQNLLAMVKQELSTTRSDTSSQKKHIYMGQILTGAAIIRSGLFAQLDAEQQQAVVELILDAGQQRNVLQSVAVTVFVDLLNRLDKRQFRTLRPVVEKHLLQPVAEQDAIALYLRALINARFDLKAKITDGLHVKVVDETHLPHITSVLLETTTNVPVHEAILQQIVDAHLTSRFLHSLETQTNDTHKHRLGYLIVIENLLKLVKVEHIPPLLSAAFFTRIHPYYKNGAQRHSNAVYTKRLQTIWSLVQQRFAEQKDGAEPIAHELRMCVITKLLLQPWNLTFERATKSKLIQQLTVALDKEHVKQLTKIYKAIVLETMPKTDANGVEGAWSSGERAEAIYAYGKLLTHAHMQTSVKWKIKHFVCLFDLAFVTNAANVNVHLADACKKSFYGNLDHRFKTLEDMSNFLYGIFAHVHTIVTTAPHTLRTPFNDEQTRMWPNLAQHIHALHDATKSADAVSNDQKWSIAFQILLVDLALQMFGAGGGAHASIADAQRELIECVTRIQVRGTGDAATDDPDWIEVVIDVFLNLSSHNSRQFHNRLVSVFPFFCDHVTPSALHQLLAVLDPEQSNILSENDEEDDDDDDSDDNDDDLSDDEENWSDEDDADAPKEQLKMAVRNVLAAQDDDDDASIDLDDMDDAHAQQLDRALSDAFRAFAPNLGRKNKKQSHTDTRLMHFRLRVLNFLRIYLDSRPPISAAIEILPTLLQLYQYAVKNDEQQPLRIKLKGYLDRLTEVRRFATGAQVTDTVLVDVLTRVLSKEDKTKTMAREMAEQIAKATLFIIRCHCEVHKDNERTAPSGERTVYHVVHDLLVDYFRTNATHTPSALFKQILQLNWRRNFDLLQLLFEIGAKEGVRTFKRAEALNLIRVFYATNQRLVRAHPKRAHKVARMRATMLRTLLERPELHAANVAEEILQLVAISEREEIDVDVIGEQLHRLDLNKGRQTYRSVCRKFNLTERGEQEKRKVEEECEEVEGRRKKKKKTKQSQFRKEKLRLREKSGGEGLSDVGFLPIDGWGMNGDDEEVA